MPLDTAAIPGTEKDGTKSLVYCKYCYNNGVFTHPEMTLDEMRAHLQGLMKPSGMTEAQIKEVLEGLPGLTRWLGKHQAV